MMPIHCSTGGRFVPTSTHDHFDAAMKQLHWSCKLEHDGIDYLNDVIHNFEFNGLVLAYRVIDGFFTKATKSDTNFNTDYQDELHDENILQRTGYNLMMCGN
ncbi:hypothetical protein RF11_14800 [Thelohanellus kitauei]|uniref:Uncharacterized protein n=1 Tax=Thelohanellus kitauei TaxID=669202 RepID=A0A0C2MR08_THEKT|nr:hypothetical protein RF11_14800 [Thelohanellus kitauei]